MVCFVPPVAAAIAAVGCGGRHHVVAPDAPVEVRRLPDARLQPAIEELIRLQQVPPDLLVSYSRTGGGYSSQAPWRTVYELDQREWRMWHENREGQTVNWDGKVPGLVSAVPVDRRSLLGLLDDLQAIQAWRLDASGVGGGWPPAEGFNVRLDGVSWIWGGTIPNDVGRAFRRRLKELGAELRKQHGPLRPKSRPME
ncbi:MAG: hypothetical protein ACYTKD_01830 [Planctomycetota bacterium]|jgi:hypothetical protein